MRNGPVTQFMPIRYGGGRGRFWELLGEKKRKERRKKKENNNNKTPKTQFLTLSERQESNNVLSRSLDLTEGAYYPDVFGTHFANHAWAAPHPARSWCQGRKGKGGKDTNSWEHSWAPESNESRVCSQSVTLRLCESTRLTYWWSQMELVLTLCGPNAPSDHGLDFSWPGSPRRS